VLGLLVSANVAKDILGGHPGHLFQWVFSSLASRAAVLAAVVVWQVVVAAVCL